jgi:hypothetical protein
MNKQQSSHQHSNALMLTHRTANALPHRATAPYIAYLYNDRALLITTAIANNALATY